MEEYREWLQSQIAALEGMDEFWADDLIAAQSLIDTAREKAYSLALPETAAACKCGPVRQRLTEILATLPPQEFLDIHGVAALLGCSVRSVSRGLISREIPQPEVTINSIQRWRRDQF